jgi:hypothetical protein
LADVCRNQRTLSQGDWTGPLAAIDAMHGIKAKAPAYRAFVNLNVQAMSMSHMSSGVFTLWWLDKRWPQFPRLESALCEAIRVTPATRTPRHNTPLLGLGD